MDDYFKGIYYNGTSSQANDVLFIIDHNTLTFSLQQNSFTWSLDNCKVIDNSFEISIKNSEESIIIQHNLESLRVHLKQKISFNFYTKLLKQKLYIHFFILLTIASILFLANQFLVPPLAEKSVSLIPISFDNSMGDNYFNQFKSIHKIDSTKTTVLNSFANHLKIKNKEKLKFYIVESDIVNAFCLPNGTIVVYTGILNIMDNENELIGLLGHEIAHYNKRHSIKALAKSTCNYMFLSLLTNDMASITGVMADNLNTLQNLSFSREHENEADQNGLKFIYKNKANPKGMVTLLEKLAEPSSLNLPELLKTHPNSKERVYKIKDFITHNKYNTYKNKELEFLFLQLKNNS